MIKLLEKTDLCTRGVIWRAEREGVVGEDGIGVGCHELLESDIALETKGPGDSLLVRGMCDGVWGEDRWVGAIADTLMNMDLGARCISGSLFLPVREWKFDELFEQLELAEYSGFVTIAISCGVPCGGWLGVPRMGLYALLEGYPGQSVEDGLLCRFDASELLVTSCLVSRYPYPHETIASPIAYMPPKDHFWPLTRVVGGMARTESTVLGVATASGSGSQEELQRRLIQTALGVEVDQLQFRTDIVRCLGKKVQRTMRLRGILPKIELL